MLLSETYKRRIQELAGLVAETVTLTAINGRSDEGTLSWFVEEYLLALGGDITTRLDTQIEANPDLKLLLSKGSTKIMPNSLVIKLIVEGKGDDKKLNEEFLITLTVNLDTNSNTVGAVKYKGIINKFNLSSKHSASDLDLFKNEIVENVLNSIKLSLQD
jgi:hypothetical protein